MDKDALKIALRAIAKAAPEVVQDLFEDYHRMPEGEQYKTGPGEAASGVGAEHMIRQYSDPAKQVALAEEYKRIADMLADFPAIKSQLGQLQTGVAAILTTLVSKGRTAAQISKSLENALVNLGILKATRADAKTVTKAESRIKSLRSELTFLNAIEGGSLETAVKAALTAKAEEEEEHIEGHEASEEHKAEDEEEKEEKKEEEEHKAFTKVASYVAAIIKGDEKEEKEIEEKADEEEKKALLSVKAQIKKANEEHDASGKFGEKDGEAKKEEKEGEDKMKSTIKTLQDQLDVVAKAVNSISTGSSRAPAASTATATIRDRVIKAISDSELSEGPALTASSLLQLKEMVDAGKVGKEVFDRKLALAEPSVKALFTVN